MTPPVLPAVTGAVRTLRGLPSVPNPLDPFVISALVNTKNSAATVAYAIRSAQLLADEIVVIDMESVDGTPELARSLGASVVGIETLPIADTTRAFSVAQTSGEWILLLDGDEMITPALAHELRRVVSDDSADVVRIPMVNYLLGSPVRHSSWSPHHDQHLRFFKRDQLEFSGRIHTEPLPVEGARIMALRYRAGRAMAHFAYTDVSHFLTKLDRYTTIEAEALERCSTAVGTLWRPAREFLIRYLLRSGWRDGWHGFHLAVLMAFYRFVAGAKAWQSRTAGGRADVQREYAVQAESLLSGRYERWP